MQQQLTIEAVIEPGDRLLARIARTVCTTPEPPECFVWSAIPDTGEVRIWMIISESETKLRALTADLGRIRGVRRVSVHGPGQAILEALVRPNSSR
jgi:hypothetical protein